MFDKARICIDTILFGAIFIILDITAYLVNTYLTDSSTHII